MSRSDRMDDKEHNVYSLFSVEDQPNILVASGFCFCYLKT